MSSAGSGGTFGFAALDDAARVLELTVNPHLGAAGLINRFPAGTHFRFRGFPVDKFPGQ